VYIQLLRAAGGPMKGMGFAELNREEIAAKFYRFAGGRLPAITGPFHELQVHPPICCMESATVGGPPLGASGSTEG